MTLGPGDSFRPGGAGRRFLEERGLLDAWSHQATSWPTVGEQLAHLPDGTLTETGSTGTLAEAEAAARADAATATVQRYSREEDSRAHVVLLRGRSIPLAGGDWRFEFDTGETRVLGAPEDFGSDWFAVSADLAPGSGQIRSRVVAADFWGHEDELTCHDSMRTLRSAWSSMR